MTMPGSKDEIAQRIRLLLAGRAVTASICPSEVARSLVQDDAGWRALMPAIREVAHAMQGSGIVRVTQHAADAGPDTRGPVRIRRGSHFESSADQPPPLHGGGDADA